MVWTQQVLKRIIEPSTGSHGFVVEKIKSSTNALVGTRQDLQIKGSTFGLNCLREPISRSRSNGSKSRSRTAGSESSACHHRRHSRRGWNVRGQRVGRRRDENDQFPGPAIFDLLVRLAGVERHMTVSLTVMQAIVEGKRGDGGARTFYDRRVCGPQRE